MHETKQQYLLSSTPKAEQKLIQKEFQEITRNVVQVLLKKVLLKRKSSSECSPYQGLLEVPKTTKRQKPMWDTEPSEKQHQNYME